MFAGFSQICTFRNRRNEPTEETSRWSSEVQSEKSRRSNCIPSKLLGVEDTKRGLPSSVEMGEYYI
jgi:hypothetical protein